MDETLETGPWSAQSTARPHPRPIVAQRPLEPSLPPIAAYRNREPEKENGPRPHRARLQRRPRRMATNKPLLSRNKHAPAPYQQPVHEPERRRRRRPPVREEGRVALPTLRSRRIGHDFDVIPIDKVVVDLSNQASHVSLSPLTVGEDAAYAHLLADEWLDTYREERLAFSSISVFCDVKLSELLHLTRHEAQSALRTAVCMDMFAMLASAVRPHRLRDLLLALQREMEPAIYVGENPYAIRLGGTKVVDTSRALPPVEEANRSSEAAAQAPPERVTHYLFRPTYFQCLAKLEARYSVDEGVAMRTLQPDRLARLRDAQRRVVVTMIDRWRFEYLRTIFWLWHAKTRRYGDMHARLRVQHILQRLTRRLAVRREKSVFVRWWAVLLRAQVSRLRHERTALRHRVQSIEVGLAKTRANKSSIEEKHALAKARIAQLRVQVKVLRYKLDELRSDLGGARSHETDCRLVMAAVKEPLRWVILLLFGDEAQRENEETFVFQSLDALQPALAPVTPVLGANADTVLLWANKQLDMATDLVITAKRVSKGAPEVSPEPADPDEECSVRMTRAIDFTTPLGHVDELLQPQHRSRFIAALGVIAADGDRREAMQRRSEAPTPAQQFKGIVRDGAVNLLRSLQADDSKETLLAILSCLMSCDSVLGGSMRMQEAELYSVDELVSIQRLRGTSLEIQEKEGEEEEAMVPVVEALAAKLQAAETEAPPPSAVVSPIFSDLVSAADAREGIVAGSEALSSARLRAMQETERVKAVVETTSARAFLSLQQQSGAVAAADVAKLLDQVDAGEDEMLHVSSSELWASVAPHVSRWELNEVMKTLKRHSRQLQRVFYRYCKLAASEDKLMTCAAFEAFVNDCRLRPSRGAGAHENVAEFVFFATCKQDKSTEPGGAADGSKSRRTSAFRASMTVPFPSLSDPLAVIAQEHQGPAADQAVHADDKDVLRQFLDDTAAVIEGTGEPSISFVQFGHALVRLAVLAFPDLGKGVNRKVRRLVEKHALVHAKQSSKNVKYLHQLASADIRHALSTHRDMLHVMFLAYATNQATGTCVDFDHLMRFAKDFTLSPLHFTVEQARKMFHDAKVETGSSAPVHQHGSKSRAGSRRNSVSSRRRSLVRHHAGPDKEGGLNEHEFRESLVAMACYAVRNPYVSLLGKTERFLSQLSRSFQRKKRSLLKAAGVDDASD